MFSLKLKLKKTRDSFTIPLKRLFNSRSTLSPEDEEAVEELLLSADVGVEASDRILSVIRDAKDFGDYKDFLKAEFLSMLAFKGRSISSSSSPKATIVIGVNGVGKTTTVAKLAHYYKTRREKVILAACDTFRAAAVSQLSLWADKIGVQFIAHKGGGDPAAVAFDACTAAVSRQAHHVVLDTAGRLHTKVNLMEELKKIKRVCERILGPDGVETILIIDATLGQNSLAQAEEFTRNLETDGIILTKLDSTAKGGIVIAISQSLGIPVKFIGVGEKLDDFSEFSPEEFVEAILA